MSVSQNYSIVEKASDSNKLFEFNIPFTDNSFWYRYNGTIKAGVNLDTADYENLGGNAIEITLDPPYIISNTPDMEKSGVLEERNNLLNPIHVEDVDALQRRCIELSESNVIEGGLMDEAKTNAEQDIRNMFTAALGDACTVEFHWREVASE